MVDPRERRRQQVHREVRAAAIELMSERGFDGVTVEQIAGRTSVSASTIYRHFGTKEALVLSPGRPEEVVARVARDDKREAIPAIRRAVNRVYGRDEGVPGELRLVITNAGLTDQFRRELADAAVPLADALAERAGSDGASRGDRAMAAASLAAITVGLLDWAAAPDKKLGKVLDDVLAVIA